MALFDLRDAHLLGNTELFIVFASDFTNGWFYERFLIECNPLCWFPWLQNFVRTILYGVVLIKVSLTGSLQASLCQLKRFVFIHRDISLLILLHYILITLCLYLYLRSMRIPLSSLPTGIVIFLSDYLWIQYGSEFSVNTFGLLFGCCESCMDWRAFSMFLRLPRILGFISLNNIGVTVKPSCTAASKEANQLITRKRGR